MQDSRFVAAARFVVVPTSTNRFALRLAISVLLTALDAAVVVAYGPSLHQVSSGNPLLATALGLLLVCLLGSLARTWFLALRAREK
jgi:hypothetical protein